MISDYILLNTDNKLKRLNLRLQCRCHRVPVEQQFPFLQAVSLISLQFKCVALEYI